MPAKEISADDAGRALSVVADRLSTANIIEPEGFSVLDTVARRIKQGRASTSWTIDVDRGNPIRFSRATDRTGNPVIPSLICSIVVDQSASAKPPFSSLDIALEVDNEENEPMGRWHVDLANHSNGVFQEGPLVHLQYGGHIAGHRSADHPLKVPRWCHPPMELALMCEVIAANFFPSQWRKFRDDTNWCDAICLYQHLCYTSYFEKLQRCMSISSTTILGSTWAANWT